ncbi:MAG: T9SS type A sorting domain-containing protein, partial [Bacteroidales bacterium]|nr:T9SS type A sorting domain-containing protein [Bacteroidales bacterium]
NPGSSALYLRVYTASNTLIKEKYIGSYSETKSVRFSDLNLQNHWGEDVYFQIRSSLGGQNILSEKVGAIFFRQIPEPTINVRQRACEPYVLFDMTLDSETINDIDNYEFRICKEGDESSSNVYELDQYGSINGNTITLNAGDFQPEDNTNYIIQIYQDVHGSSPPNMADISCARDMLVSLGDTPEQIVFTNTLTEYTFTDYQNITHTYHITRNGLSNGETTLSLTELNDVRLDRFQVRINDNPFWQTINVQPYDPGVYLYQNLDTGLYHLRAVDSDGCFSAEVSDFEIIEPDPLIIDSVRSTLVSCHENNTGTGSHSDAMINTFWNGGIGTYNVSVKNTASEIVYEEDSINTYDKQTLNNLPVGTYLINVSDNYGSEAIDKFTVESNPEMILSGVATDYRCNGDGNGTIELSVENKTTEYVDFYLTDQAVIHTNEDTTFYNFLDIGNYTASVINTKGCEDIVTGLVIDQPNVLELTGTTTHPICYDSYEGSVITNTDGGNGNYQYLWSNGETTPDIFNLNNGSYTVTVTDSKDCSNQKTFEITPPAAPTAGWDETSAILCTGNTLTLDGGDFVLYEWQKDGNIISSKRILTLSETGTYTLTLTNDLGCISTDTFELEVSDHTLDAVLLLQDSAGVNELTEVIDVTWPIPDSVNWVFDKPVVLDETGSWYQQFLSEDEGIITVTLRAWSDGCFSDSSKTITIFNNNDRQEKQISEESPLILGFKVYPNPNNGDFRLAVKLSRQADIELKVFSLVKGSVIHDKIHKGLDKYVIPYNMNNLMKGAYIIILTAEHERQSLKFIVK